MKAKRRFTPPTYGKTTVILDPLPPGEGFTVGTRVTGQVFHPLNIGWRDGDYFEGVITDKVTDDIQIVTNWKRQTHMGLIEILDTAAFDIRSFPEAYALRFDDFAIITPVNRRRVNGKKFYPIPHSSEVYERIQAAADKAIITRGLNRLAKQYGTRIGFKAA